jgi:hypothetical protein
MFFNFDDLIFEFEMSEGAIKGTLKLTELYVFSTSLLSLSPNSSQFRAE